VKRIDGAREAAGMTLRSAWGPVLAAALSAVVLPGAANERQPAEINPIAPSIRLNRARVPQGSALEITYTWALEPGAKKLRQDYRTFVHFLDNRGTMLFADDHPPEPPSSTWEPGQTYSYRRTLFVPVSPYVGSVEVRMGLYPHPGPGERPALKGVHRGLREYKVSTFELLPQTENIALVYQEGWNDPETLPESPSVGRTWTRKDARVSFRNPKRNVIVYLEGDTCAACFSKPPELTLRVGRNVGLRVPIEGPEAQLKKIRVKAADLGAVEWVDLRLSMSESFVPRHLTPPLSDDDRELGFSVYHLYVAEAETVGPAPGIVDAVALPPTRER
jgi:hypothetical protein